jgi:hypothetical protein
MSGLIKWAWIDERVKWTTIRKCTNSHDRVRIMLDSGLWPYSTDSVDVFDQNKEISVVVASASEVITRTVAVIACSTRVTKRSEE